MSSKKDPEDGEAEDGEEPEKTPGEKMCVTALELFGKAKEGRFLQPEIARRLLIEAIRAWNTALSLTQPPSHPNNFVMRKNVAKAHSYGIAMSARIGKDENAREKHQFEANVRYHLSEILECARVLMGVVTPEEASGAVQVAPGVMGHSAATAPKANLCAPPTPTLDMTYLSTYSTNFCTVILREAREKTTFDRSMWILREFQEGLREEVIWKEKLPSYVPKNATAPCDKAGPAEESADGNCSSKKKSVREKYLDIVQKEIDKSIVISRAEVDSVVQQRAAERQATHAAQVHRQKGTNRGGRGGVLDKYGGNRSAVDRSV